MAGPSEGVATNMAARLTLFWGLISIVGALRCDWGYEGQNSGPTPYDGRFALNMSSNGNGYLPNAEYTGNAQSLIFFKRPSITNV